MNRPPHAYVPPPLRAGRAWGFGIHLYALRSRRNWGIGDFTDLDAFVAFAKNVGADLVGLNPLHALHYVEPEAASPYSPTSRYFRNPLYIDVETIAEYRADHPTATALRERVESRAFGELLASLRTSDYVDYGRVARAKYSAFEACYAVLRELRGDRLADFRAYCERGGERLESFARFEALNERFASHDGHARGWPMWPPEFHDPHGAAVERFALERRRRIDYFKYLQWLADDQLGRVARNATAMAIGLYLDVAVGVDASSADVWSDQTAYVLDETVGAPPDPLGPLGQNWGLPPLDPNALVRDDGERFAALLAANMKHAGALRLDHVMALQRLYRIPRGESARAGRYVEYPLETLLAIASTESTRARCLIVGEDLGTVPEGFRERMEREAILSYRLLLFERYDDGSFRFPWDYPARALATATTHDLPTLIGWSIGRDLDARERAGLTDPVETVAAKAHRRIEVTQLLRALHDAGELSASTVEMLHRTVDTCDGDVASYESLVRSAYRFLARSPARVVLVQLDDASGEFEQVNLPGTFVEYPNWRRKNSLTLERIAADERIAALTSDVRHLVREGSPA